MGDRSAKERPGPYHNGTLLAMVPVELHHGLEREIADHVTVEDEEWVCSLREQIAGQCQGSSWGRRTGCLFPGGLRPWIQAQQAPRSLGLIPPSQP